MASVIWSRIARYGVLVSGSMVSILRAGVMEGVIELYLASITLNYIIASLGPVAALAPRKAAFNNAP